MRRFKRIYEPAWCGSCFISVKPTSTDSAPIPDAAAPPPPPATVRKPRPVGWRDAGLTLLKATRSVQTVPCPRTSHLRRGLAASRRRQDDRVWKKDGGPSVLGNEEGGGGGGLARALRRLRNGRLEEWRTSPTRPSPPSRQSQQTGLIWAFRKVASC